MSQDTNVNNLIINKLTKQQYASIATPDPTQLYFVTDEGESISILDDVTLTALTNGDALIYDSTSQKWENVSGVRYIVESGRNGIDYWEIYSDGTLEQGGSCTSGTPIVFTKAFDGTDYVLPVPYSAKTATGFTPSATGDWIAKGMKASS